MRIRSTKPDFWRSERIASVSWDARLVLKGLESYVDDNGVGRDDLALIVGDLFQRDLVREHSRTLARVSEAISALESAGLLWRYDHEGTDLLFIAFWESVQRVDKPQPGRFPRPDGTWNYKESLIRESLANIREHSRTFAPGTGEQGNRGTGEQTSTSRIASDPDGGPDDNPKPEIVSLCEYLADRVRSNGHKAKVGKLWYRECRLLIDTDGHTPDQIRNAITWATTDPFWSANIRSMRTLREKYTTLQARARQASTKKPMPIEEDWGR